MKFKITLSPARFLWVLALLIPFSFSECKKGTDDPKISFRTRKARLCGSWNLTSGSSNLRVQKKGSAPTSLSIQKMNGTTATVWDDFNWATYEIQYYLSLEIKKDGTFTLYENYSGSVLMASGTWNFAGGGKYKNKEAVVFMINKVDNGSTGNHLFNKECTEFTYELTELRNSKVVMDISNDILINSNGDKIEFSGKFTFES